MSGRARRARPAATLDGAHAEFHTSNRETPVVGQRAHSDGGPIYPWAILKERLAELASSGREDQAAFFRHGQTLYNERGRLSGRHNTQLSDAGRAQAFALRERLPDRVDLIACSPLARAVETMALAVPSAMRCRAAILVEPRLSEINLGMLQGRSRARIGQIGRAGIDDAPLAGESLRTAAARILSAIVDLFTRLAADDEARTAVVFCHAGVIRVLSTLIHPPTALEDFAARRFPNGCRLDLRTEQLRLPEFWMAGSSGSG